MTPRRINLMLWTLTAALALASVGSVLLAVLLPAEAEVPNWTPTRPGRATATSAPSAALPLSSFERIWSMSLRQKLTDDVAAPVVATPAAVASGLPVTLVGTIGDSLAMFRSTAGGDAVEIRAVGESWLNVEVVAVRPSRVDVRFNGQVVTLEKPPEPK